jgi:hypothetical protein
LLLGEEQCSTGLERQQKYKKNKTKREKTISKVSAFSGINQEGVFVDQSLFSLDLTSSSFFMLLLFLNLSPSKAPMLGKSTTRKGEERRRGTGRRFYTVRLFTIQSVPLEWLATQIEFDEVYHTSLHSTSFQ